MNLNRSSWKTSSAGISAAITAFLTLIVVPITDSDPATVPQWGVFIPLLITAASSWFARDNDKSSKDVGVQ